MTTELNKLTDEQLEENFAELQNKQDLTEDELSQLSQFKEEKQTRYQKRIDKLTYESKSAKEENERLRLELEEFKRNQQSAQPPQNNPIINKETVAIDGQSFFTDEALESMVEAGEITPQKAYAHQRARDKAEAIVEAVERVSKSTTQNKEQMLRDQDRQEVLRDYPHFNPQHPSFNPSDPLWQKADELYKDGLYANPQGMTKAIKLAKQLLGLSNKRPDMSDDFSVGQNRGTTPLTSDRDVALSPEEREIAVRTYVMGGVTNPSTGRVYTEKEAIEKTLKAKQARARR